MRPNEDLSVGERVFVCFPDCLPMRGTIVEPTKPAGWSASDTTPVLLDGEVEECRFLTWMVKPFTVLDLMVDDA